MLALLAVLALPTSLALPAPLSPPFRHWRTSKRGRHQGCNNVTRDVTAYGASPAADAATNQAAINTAFAAMQMCDTLLIPEGTYDVVGGIHGENLRNATIVVNGVLNFVDPTSDAFRSWPMSPTSSAAKFKYADCFHIHDSIDVAITSDSRGTLNGNGRVWWNKMIVGDLPPHNQDSRPKMLVVRNSADLLIEYVDLLNSPSWTLVPSAVRAEIRFVTVETDRNHSQALKKQAFGDIKHRLEEWLLDKAVNFLPSWILQPEDLNTDGIDPSGADFWIHDCSISNDDDSIAVKPSRKGGPAWIDGSIIDCTHNMLIENMKLVGFGASIGSVSPEAKRGCVDGITMRNISMPGTGKGIYIKSNGNDCVGKSAQLSNLRFENIDIDKPSWYAIWIGPQQQQEPNSKLGLDCSLIYPLAHSKCPTQGCADFENITLKDITITNPLLSPGAIMGNSSNPMRNLVFDNVVVKQDSLVRGRFPWLQASFPWSGTYKSIHAPGVCIDCSPVPPGFSYVSRGSSNEAIQHNGLEQPFAV